MHIVTRVGIALTVGATSACGVTLRQLTPGEYADASAHAVFVSGDGYPLRPSTTHAATSLMRTADTDSAYGAWIHGILMGLRASGRRDILLRIHGGTVRLGGAAADTEITSRIMNESSFYPIYLNWESSIQRSYADHLFRVRQGEAYRGWDAGGVWLAPLYFVGDAGRAIAHTPITWTVQGKSFFAGGGATDGVAWEPAKRVHAALFDASRPSGSLCQNGYTSLTSDATVHVEFGPDCRSRWSRLLSTTVGVVTTIGILPYDRNAGRIGHNTIGRASLKLPTHLLWPRLPLFSTWASRHIAWLPLRPIASLVIDMIGAPAFDNMHRRTQMMIHLARDDAQRDGTPPLAYRPATGAVAQLMDSLQALVASAGDTMAPRQCAWSAPSAAVRRSADPPYRVTIVAHSLGAVIATDIVRGCPGIPFRNIVFIGAAATENEVESSIVPFLRSDSAARFFNLTVHPAAERDEWPNGNWAVAQGSMLSWLDGFIRDPRTDGERMLGTYENAITEIHAIPNEVRNRVYIKSFPYLDRLHNRGLPYRHADFTNQPFWTCEFWMPAQSRHECAPTPVRVAPANVSSASVPPPP
jgi:hypothetical protein